jgi:hypothetical protein
MFSIWKQRCGKRHYQICSKGNSNTNRDIGKRKIVIVISSITSDMLATERDGTKI